VGKSTYNHRDDLSRYDMALHLDSIRGPDIGVPLDFGVTFQTISGQETHLSYCFQFLSMKSSMSMPEIS
jgi:hypothetical protein